MKKSENWVGTGNFFLEWSTLSIDRQVKTNSVYIHGYDR